MSCRPFSGCLALGSGSVEPQYSCGARWLPLNLLSQHLLDLGDFIRYGVMLDTHYAEPGHHAGRFSTRS